MSSSYRLVVSSIFPPSSLLDSEDEVEMEVIESRLVETESEDFSNEYETEQPIWITEKMRRVAIWV